MCERCIQPTLIHEKLELVKSEYLDKWLPWDTPESMWPKPCEGATIVRPYSVDGRIYGWWHARALQGARRVDALGERD